MNLTEPQSFSPWTNTKPPSRILVIRLHAVGDVAITLPYCSALREHFPKARIDFLTSTRCAGLVAAVTTFDAVHVVKISGQRTSRVFTALRWALFIRKQNYEVIVDLQRNWMTRMMRILGNPDCWGEFNRFAPFPAGERVQETFAKMGFVMKPEFKSHLNEKIINHAREVLRTNGWDGDAKLIVLNPAGLWDTRNWPVDNYVQLAKLWAEREDAKFLVLGTDQVNEKASILEKQLGKSLINLAGKTTLEEAFGIVQFASGIVSEDSGLMHMAWVSGIPTVTLFGSSRRDWSTPLGKHSVCLHSADLECGACMKSICRFGDVHCLTRYTPAFVLDRALQLMSA